MTQQPNQNYPQPGQGWGQQGQQPQNQWGQPAQPQQQWGQQTPAAPAAPSYGQPAQQQWGSSASTGGSSAGEGSIGKIWALYAAIAAAVIALVTLFLDWAGASVTGNGADGDIKLSVTAFTAKTTLGGKSVPGGPDDHPTRIWGILLIVGAVVLIVGAVLAMLKKTKLFGWIQTGGAVVVLGSAIGEVIYLNGKMSDIKKSITDGGASDGAKYSVGLHYGAWVALVVTVAAVAFSVLTVLSMTEGSGSASGSAYGSSYGQPAAQQAYGQQAGGYGQQQGGGYGQQQPAQQQWGQSAQPQQQGWGQQDAPGQQQGWGQQQANPFGDPANQPTQAVQQQYPPQPPQ